MNLVNINQARKKTGMKETYSVHGTSDKTQLDLYKTRAIQPSSKGPLADA